MKSVLTAILFAFLTAASGHVLIAQTPLVGPTIQQARFGVYDIPGMKKNRLGY